MTTKEVVTSDRVAAASAAESAEAVACVVAILALYLAE